MTSAGWKDGRTCGSNRGGGFALTDMAQVGVIYPLPAGSHLKRTFWPVMSLLLFRQRIAPPPHTHTDTPPPPPPPHFGRTGAESD